MRAVHHNSIDELVKYYKEEINKFQVLLDQLAYTIQGSDELRTLIHSTKQRVKEPDHLRNKLKTKVAENPIINHVNNINAMVIGRSRYLLIVSVDIENNVLAGEVEVQLNEIRNDLIAISPEILFVYIDVRNTNRSTC